MRLHFVQVILLVSIAAFPIIIVATETGSIVIKELKAVPKESVIYIDKEVYEAYISKIKGAGTLVPPEKKPGPGDTILPGANKPLGYVYGNNIEMPDPYNGHEFSGKEYPAFDSPGGVRTGTLIVSVARSLCLFSPSHLGSRIQPGKRALIGRGECGDLFYYERKDGYVRVLDRSVPEGFWIPLEYTLPENPGMRLSFTTRNILERISDASSFMISNFNEYVLRDSPNPGANEILILDESKHAVTEFTGKVHNVWAEVEVYEVSGFPPEEGCYSKGHLKSFKTNSYKGWIKVLEADGVPGKIRWSGIC